MVLLWCMGRAQRAFEKFWRRGYGRPAAENLYEWATSDFGHHPFFEIRRWSGKVFGRWSGNNFWKPCMSTCLLPQTLHTPLPTSYTIGMVEARDLCGSGPPGRPAKRRASAAEPVCMSTFHVRNLFPDLVETFSRRWSRVKKSVCMSTSNVQNRCQFL